MPFSVDPPFTTARSSRDAGRAPELDLMRVRLLLVVGATFVIALLVGGGHVAPACAGPGVPRMRRSSIAGPPAAAVGLAIAFALAIALVARMTRHIIRPAEELASSRHDLGDLYESARSRALEDSLTGPGQPPRLPGGVREHARPERPLTGWTWPCCSSTSTTSRPSTTRPATPSATTCWSRWAAFSAAGSEPPIACSASAATSSRSCCRTRMRTTPGSSRTGCWRPASSRGRSGSFRRGFAFSGGLTSAPAFATTRDKLLNQADEALYQAKRDGRCLVRVFDPARARRRSTSAALSERSAAVADVLNGGGLRPVFQPIIDLRNGEVLAFEGLTRLPDGTPFRDPGVLFEAAEAAGRTYELDLACVTAILDAARTIDRRIGLSLNLSPRTLETPEFAPTIRGPAFDGRLGASRVIIELTERDAVQDIDQLRRVLDRLRATGLRIAADDVGAGNAGLRLLSQIHFDIVKLDLGLVQEGARARDLARGRPVPGRPRGTLGRHGDRGGSRDARPAAAHPEPARSRRRRGISWVDRRWCRTSARSISTPSSPGSVGLRGDAHHRDRRVRAAGRCDTRTKTA